MIKTYIKILELYIQERDEIEEEIQNLIDKQLDEGPINIEKLKSIHGIANKTIVAILGECGDLIIIAKKLTSIIYSLFKYNRAYNPCRVLIQHKR